MLTSTESKHQLINELKAAAIKHNPEKIVAITRLYSNKIVFLEKGHRRAGLQHILEKHSQDFANRGIPPDKIAEAIMFAIMEGEKIGIQGKNRAIYKVVFQFLTLMNLT